MLDEDALGDGNAGVTAEPSESTPDGGITESPAEDACETYVEQSGLAVMATVGPYLFLKFEERTYDCEETMVLLEDRFLTFDLTDGTRVDVTTEEEVQPLFELEDVKNLEREGTVNLIGVVPFYNAAFNLRLTYHFAAKSIFVADDGVRHSLVSVIQVPARELPKSLVPHARIPSFVSAFGLVARGHTPGGFWLVRGSPEQVAAQMSAFLQGQIQHQETDE